jgi:hypothetical protein
LKLFDAHQYAEAQARFQRALELTGSPNARFYVARCLREMGKLVEAYDEIQLALREARERAATEPKYAETRDLAAAELAYVESKVGRLVIALVDAPEGTEIKVNGSPLAHERVGVAIGVEPGAVVVVATAPDARQISQTIEVPMGQMKTCAMAFKASPTPAPSPAPPPAREPARTTGGGVRAAGFVTAGVGVAGIAVFAVAGVIAQKKFDEVEEGCGGTHCVDPKYDDVITTGRTMDTLANVGLIVGVVGVAAGAAMMIFGGPKPEGRKAAAVWPHGNHHASWRASF